MPSDFVPFLPAIRTRLASASPASEFSPALSAGPPETKPLAAHSGEVKVELKRDGDRVSQIRIHCRCGEVIELDCSY